MYGSIMHHKSKIRLTDTAHTPHNNTVISRDEQIETTSVEGGPGRDRAALQQMI